MRMLAVVLLLFVGACAATGTARQVPGPDPYRAYFLVECERDAGKCYEVAAETCRGAYQIVNQQGGQQTTGYIPAGRTVVAAQRYEGQLLIMCGPPAAAPGYQTAPAYQQPVYQPASQ